jgi:hypothetical protein
LDANCNAETFTATRTGANPASAHKQAWRQACGRTQCPIGTINPDSSAMGTNFSGWIRPRSGCCQRINASTPLISPVFSAILGWYVRIGADSDAGIDVQMFLVDRTAGGQGTEKFF